jgi:probable H4MPT-linked C1 transfer pathway protein
MMHENLVGWDLGGAHVKAASLDASSVVHHVIQRPCPLWRGISQLRSTLRSVLEDMEVEDVTHAVTMTGELADVFKDRAAGVRELLDVVEQQFAGAPVMIYAGHVGFMTPANAAREAEQVASANWLAAATLVATWVPEGLYIDVGSTTTDMVVIASGQVQACGHSDHERLACSELVYTGVVRTPIIAIADRAAFAGVWISLMAEHFATMADVYRLTHDLPEYADMLPSANGGDKSEAGSARRLARMLGRDAASANAEWRRVAEYLAECQLTRLREACEINLSRGLLAPDAPLIGAGVGRFLVRDLASRLQRGFLDFGAFFPPEPLRGGAAIADCAPAVAVALLASQHMAGQSAAAEAEN